MKNKTLKIFSILVFIAAAFVFLYIFGKPVLLRAYVQTGIGGATKQPIFSTCVSDEIANAAADEGFKMQLKCWELPEMRICAPKNFLVIKEEITKVYYKKLRPKIGDSTMYLMSEPPNFFVGIFPELKGFGITEDYEFIERMVNAKISEISTMKDAFFVIIKSIFTSNLGDQKNLKVIKFNLKDRRGFITYNIEASGHYFDCNVFDAENNYFKIYIRDLRGILGLPEVFAVISTASRV